ncbi:MAG: FHA domain-containing protein [Planctomycetota bacterium]|nr:MAG: FHA domain-containing protein [Planctomycetota bacterium]
MDTAPRWATLSSMPFRLILIDGEAQPSQLSIDGPLELGRDPHCDIRLLGDSASRYHLRLEPQSGGVLVSDHRSRNGTWIEGERLNTPALAGDGSRLSAGGATWVILAEEQLQKCIIADGGLSLKAITAAEPRPWAQGDDPAELSGLHALTRRLAALDTTNERAALLVQLCNSWMKSDRCCIVRKHQIISGSCSPRLAKRLATGQQARLLVLGQELRGQTIAAEAVGSAATLPLAEDCWLLVVRGLDGEALSSEEFLRLNRLASEASPYFAQRNPHPLSELVGTSACMQRLRERILRISQADSTVLISGESGSGKELIARCLHRASGRCDGPLVTVNCAAVAPSLFEAELFGHEKGAFSGADQARPGRIRAAHGGTLFLDEIGELPLELQAKLLRVLQEGQVEPVGAHQPISVDVRIMSATNRDLASEVAAGRFREDLFYRLDVLRIVSPALRERREDIPILAAALLERLSKQHQRPPPALSPEALRILCQESWPGNIRQLANTLERALVLSETTITPADLELSTIPTASSETPPPPPPASPK